MKKLLLRDLASLIILSVFYFIPVQVFASGILITRDSNVDDGWDYSNEADQQAFINYEDGMEKLIVSVKTENINDKDTVWIFPIPADPDKIKIEAIEGLPNIYNGGDIANTLDIISKVNVGTQIYTIPSLVAPYLPAYDSSHPVSPNSEWSSSVPEELINEEKLFGLDTTLHMRFDKKGIVTEVLTAETATGLYDYFKNKGLKIGNGSISVLDSYIGKNYSFVASWLSPSIGTEEKVEEQEIRDYAFMFLNERYPRFYSLAYELAAKKYPGFLRARDKGEFLKSSEGQRLFQELMADPEANAEVTNAVRRWKREGADGRRGVMVTFPTQELYFPLLPTSVYKDKVIPITIRILGHVSPDIFRDINAYTKVNYYVGGYTDTSEAANVDSWNKLNESGYLEFHEEGGNDIEYTKIAINAPSESLTQDLWIRRQKPKISILLFINQNPILSLIILLILSSIISGILAGLIFLKDLRRNPIKLGLIGLSNFFTIIGLVIATYKVGTKNDDKDIKPVVDELKEKGYFWRGRLSIILHIIAWPVLIYGAIIFLLSTSLDAFIKDSSPIKLIIFYVLPILFIILSDRLQKVEEGDRALFEQLKSRSLFRSKDKNKIGFVIFFSGIFILVSNLLVALIGLGR